MGTDTHTRYGLADVLADGWRHASGNVRTFDVVPGVEDAATFAADVLRAEREHAEAEASWTRSQGDADGDAAADVAVLAAATVRPRQTFDDRTGAWAVEAWTVTLGDGSTFHVHAFPDGTASGAWAVGGDAFDAGVLADAREHVLGVAEDAVREAATGGDVVALAGAAARYADVAAWAAEADAAGVAADVATLVAEEWASREAWTARSMADRASTAVRDALGGAA